MRGHLDGKEDVDGADDVVVLREDGAVAVDHRVGRRPLLAKVHHRVRLERIEGLREELKVADVAHLQIDVLPRDLAPPGPSTTHLKLPSLYKSLVACNARAMQGQFTLLRLMHFTISQQHLWQDLPEIVG